MSNDTLTSLSSFKKDYFPRLPAAINKNFAALRGAYIAKVKLPSKAFEME
jgi:hypothetical protein